MNTCSHESGYYCHQISKLCINSQICDPAYNRELAHIKVAAKSVVNVLLTHPPVIRAFLLFIMNLAPKSLIPTAYDRGSDSVDYEESDASPQRSRAKRKQTAVACISCQKRKSKVSLVKMTHSQQHILTRTQCDGRRPTCSLCEKRMTKCEYNGDTASRRLGNLRRLNADLSEKIDKYEEQVTFLRSITNPLNVQAAVEQLKAAGDGVVSVIRANRHTLEDNSNFAPCADSSEQNTLFEVCSISSDYPCPVILPSDADNGAPRKSASFHMLLQTQNRRPENTSHKPLSALP